MNTDMRFSWPKIYRQRAIETNRALFAVAVDDRTAIKPSLGQVTLYGPMDQPLAIALAEFVIGLRTGKSPAEAFAAVAWPEGVALTGGPTP